MKLRKSLALLLSSAMMFAVSGCGSKTTTTSQDSSNTTTSSTQTSDTNQAAEETTDGENGKITDGNYGGLVPMADADEPITFKVFVRDPDTAPSKNNPVLKRITELTGVTIEFEFLVGDLAQKQGVMIAGEDYPDAIFAEASKFIDAGAFIPLEDIIPNYGNLSKLYSQYGDKMTVADGHQYILELYGAYLNPDTPPPTFYNGGSGFYIQKAVLEEAGYTIPRTLDEYFTLIENYKDKYPEIDGVKTIGFEVLCDGWRDFCLRNPAQHLMGAGNDGDVFVDLDTMEASYYQITDTAKEYYRKLNDEYQQGNIEAETFTENYDQYISRISTGAVLGFFDQYWNFSQGENVLKTDGKYERTYISVPIANPGVQDGYLDAASGSITGNNGIGITKNCKDPERLLAFYDYLLQPEVQNYLQWGEEGKDYIVLENGGRVLTEERRAINNDNARKRDETGQTLWNYSPKHQGLYEDGSPCGPGESEDEFLASQSEYDQKFLSAYGYKYPAEMLSDPVKRPKYFPVWSMSIEDGSPAAVSSNKMVDICRKYYPRLVICNPDEYDALWEEFLAEFNGANLQPYLDEVNSQIKAIMSK